MKVHVGTMPIRSVPRRIVPGRSASVTTSGGVKPGAMSSRFARTLNDSSRPLVRRSGITSTTRLRRSPPRQRIAPDASVLHCAAVNLNALARLEKGLSARIRRDVTSSEPEKAEAIRVVHRVVGPVLLDLLEDHKRALDRYEQAILFIGDAANPKNPK